MNTNSEQNKTSDKKHQWWTWGTRPTFLAKSWVVFWPMSWTILSILSLTLLVCQTLFQNFWFLAFFSLIPLFFASKKLSEKENVQIRKSYFNFLGPVTIPILVGFIYFLVVTYPLSTLNTWWWTVSNGFFWEQKWLVYFVVTVGISVFCSFLMFGLIFLVFKKLSKPAEKNYFLILALPLVWVIAEFLRVKIIFNLEWETYGQPLIQNLFFARAAATFGGVYNLSFIAILTNICLFIFINSLYKNSMADSPESSARPFKKIEKNIPILYVLFIIIAIGINSYLIEKKPPFLEEKLQIAIISPRLKTTEIIDQNNVEYLFNLIEKSTTNNPHLVILPENIFPSFLIDEKTNLPTNYSSNSKVRENFNKLIKISTNHPKISFILGLHTSKKVGVDETVIETKDTEVSRFNSAVIFENGKIVSIYNKNNLLPFTEKSFSFLESVHIDPLSEGQGGETVQTQYGNFLPLICSEILISQPTPQKSQAKPIAFINLGNDNIFDSQRIMTTNKALSRIRAIQGGLPVIRSAKGGFSGVFDKTGRETGPKNIETQPDFAEIIFTTIDIPGKIETDRI